MATSSVFSIQYTRDELLTASLRKLGVIAQGQTPDAEAITNAAMAMNMAIAEFRAIGMPLWQRMEHTWTPTTGTYNIGTGYTLSVPYPVKLLQAYRTDSNSSKVPMIIDAAEDFNVLPISTGTPLRVNYTPKLNYGVIKLWPQPNNTNTSTVTLVYQGPFEYFTGASQTMAFPEEWYNALVYKTAVLLAPEWGVPLQDRGRLEKDADIALSNALATGQEDGSFFFSPDRNRF